MRKSLILTMMLICSGASVNGADKPRVVADASSREPLPNASVFDREGNFLCMSRRDGRLPYISPASYPVTIRYMGYRELSAAAADGDTLFMREQPRILPDVVLESRQQKVLHIMAYVREYSSLTSYTDTVTLFREKMVDYMIPQEPKRKFKGWRTPRVLASKSYYRFTNNRGLDSVSDRCNYHFSWADWVGIAPPSQLPQSLLKVESAVDTIRGKYSPAESWLRSADRVTVDVNVLADSSSRRWVPDLSIFFHDYMDFEQFRLRLNYSDVIGREVTPLDLTGYSFNIESNGRGMEMFMFNRPDQRIYVTTYGEVYMLEKELITEKEARSWERKSTEGFDMEILEPADAPALQPSTLALVDRVNGIDHTGTRLEFTPDHRLAGRRVTKLNFGQAVLSRLKQMFGIDHINARRKWKRQWRDFRHDRVKRNHDLYPVDD